MEYSKHTSYFFIPIWMDASDSFRDLIDAIDSSEQWMLRHDEIRYMLKFVADKIDSRNEEMCLIFHYLLRYGCRKTYGLPGVDQCFETVGAFPFRESGQPIRFQVVDAHLFCFSTRVCILAFQVVFDNQTPAWVADALFALKRASTPLKLSGQEGGTVTSMLDIARQMMSQFSQISGFSVFGYANPNTERSNVLTYLEVADHPSYEKELFHLRNCYHVGIPYVPNEELDKQQTFQASQDVVWGTSPEAAVCLACPDRGDRGFTENVFFENFNSQYLVMYILLLHQKYALYMFLTELGVGRYNTLETLESYRQRLYEFKTDFVFSFITEVPQYQNLYSNMMQAFALEQLYQDVQEPLVSLAEIRRESEDEKQKRRDASVNSALGLLSVLGFFSILVDGVDFLDFLLGGVPDKNQSYHHAVDICRPDCPDFPCGICKTASSAESEAKKENAPEETAAACGAGVPESLRLHGLFRFSGRIAAGGRCAQRRTAGESYAAASCHLPVPARGGGYLSVRQMRGNSSGGLWK